MDGTTWPAWIGAIGGVFGTVAAPIVAVYAIRAQSASNSEERCRQEREHREALERQDREARAVASEARSLAASERLWGRRVTTYVLAICYLKNWRAGVEMLVREYGLLNVAQHGETAQLVVDRLEAELLAYGSNDSRELWAQAKQTLAEKDINAAVLQMRSELDADHVAATRHDVLRTGVRPDSV